CLAFAREYSGADYVINSAETSFETRKQQIDEITSGIGVDVVFGCVGTTRAFGDGVRLMKRAGTYIEIGNLVDSAPVEFDLSRDLCAKHATYIGMCINTPSAFNKAFNILLKHKNFNFQKIFTHRCGLEELDKVLNQGKNRDYVKGLVEFKK
ncbi:MAG: zinc-binding dehydrogenase, partial [Treponema sp.]|nr:zinc-binding dehydrogenase [Treponema sp.]